MLKKALQQRPYLLLLLPVVALIIASFFVRGQHADLHISDTMLVIYAPHIYWAAAFCLIAVVLIYEGSRRFLKNKKLILLHVALTFLLLLAVIGLVTGWFTRSDNDYTATFQRKMELFQMMYGSIFFLLITTQFIFLFNLIWGIIYTIRKKHS